MIDPIVRLVKIEPMRAALVNAVSRTPEIDASTVLLTWAQSKGLLDNPSTYLRFGRNNPPPSPDKEEYGYDCMITVDPEIEPEGNIKTHTISGGLYAVVRTNLTNIGKMWHWLYDWVENSKYKIADHGLEELLSGDESDLDSFLLDLWLPLA
ncbi:MAG: AraC family transcriptional regulator [Candidatus Hodarchaeales archaeon]|jgi:AraC family transcriptional regulator